MPFRTLLVVTLLLAATVSHAHPTIVLDALSEAQIAAVKNHNSRPFARVLQVGIHREVNPPLGPQYWEPLGNGSKLTRMTLTSPGAFAVRTGLRVSDSGDARFRFRGSGEWIEVDATEVRAMVAASGLYWSPVTNGDTQTMEIVIPTGAPESGFRLEQLSHFIVSPWDRLEFAKAAAACEVDVACYGQLGSTRNAVAKLMFTSNCGAGGVASTCACSGTLMNDRASSFTPYMIASNPCIPTQQVASTVTTLWFYERASCGSNMEAANRTQVSGGASLLLGSELDDVAFLRLNNPAPPGALFSGWDPNPLATNNEVFVIHHPEGDVKKTSLGRVRQMWTDPANRKSYALVSYTVGTTEPGSAGGGLFTPNPDTPGSYRYRGFYYGGFSNCTNTGNLNDSNNLDYFTTFDVLYPKLRSWLDPAVSEPTTNYSDIWWNPNESGWGLTLADHETQLFGVWYTYQPNGQPVWYVIPGGTFTQGRRLFAGDLYRTSGPPYNRPFDSTAVTVTKVGTVTFDFAPSGLPNGTGLFTYSLGGITQSKQIQRQTFGDADPLWGADYTDIWWDPNESGWGMTLAQHGNNIFGVWYTYGADGQPLFVVLPGGTFETDTRFGGTLYTTTGPSFSATPFDSSQVRVTAVGSATIDLEGSSANGVRGFLPRGRVTMTVNGHTQVKTITRQPFGNATPRVAPVPERFLLVIAFGRTSSSSSQPGTGTVVSSPAGINCPTLCQATFPAGTNVTLTATPAAGSRFVSFTGTCSGTSCVLPMSANASVMANFERLAAASTLEIEVVTQLPAATVGQPYDVLAATAKGGVPPYTFLPDTFANGVLPLGLAITVNGRVQGTPSENAAPGVYTLGICVVDLMATKKCAPSSVVVLARNTGGAFAGAWSGTYEETEVSTGTTAAPYANYTYTCRGTWNATATAKLAFEMVLNDDVTCVFANNTAAPFKRFGIFQGQIPDGGGQTLLRDTLTANDCHITADFSLPKRVAGSAACNYPNNGSGQTRTKSIRIAGQ